MLLALADRTGLLRTEIAQPRSVRIAGRLSFVISSRALLNGGEFLRPSIRSGLLTQGWDSRSYVVRSGMKRREIAPNPQPAKAGDARQKAEAVIGAIPIARESSSRLVVGPPWPGTPK